jgi:hypothetical protein
VQRDEFCHWRIYSILLSESCMYSWDGFAVSSSVILCRRRLYGSRSGHCLQSLVVGRGVTLPSSLDQRAEIIVMTRIYGADKLHVCVNYA